MIRKLLNTLILTGGITVCAAPAPNFLVILLDDVGWHDLGFTGNTFVETPNIDRLAQKGVRFSNAYSTHPFCSPARESMLTGQWPARTAWMQRFEVNNPDAPRGGLPFIPAGAASWTHRRPEFVSIAEAMKGANYATGHFGKWHFGIHGQDISPEKEGFDVNFGGNNEVGAVKNHFAPFEGLPGNVSSRPGEYLTDRLTDEVIRYITANKDRPFYVQLWHYAPHTPIQAPEDVVEKYRKKRRALGDDSLNPTYAAMIDCIDQGVGRIFQTLEKLGLAENTVILFTSDNGGVASLGSVPITSMAPLRGHKQLIYEGGVREPMFVYWPGKTTGGQSDAPVSIMDFYSTVLDIAGIPYPDQPKDGLSLVPLLTGGEAAAFKDRSLFWYNVTGGISDEGDVFQPAGAVLKGSWRLVKNFERPLELYDLSSDPGESVNLAASHPEKAAELEKLLDGWLAGTGVITPTKNPAYDPDYVVPRQVDALPDGMKVSKHWKLDSSSCGWSPVRMVNVSFHDNAMRMQETGIYPEIKTTDVSGLPAGRYAMQVELNVPTSGRIRMAWKSESGHGDVEFFPQRDGQWHTLTAVFQTESPLTELHFAAPTHLEVTGHYDPKTQPDWIEVRSIQLLSASETETKPVQQAVSDQQATRVFSDYFSREEIGSNWNCDTDGIWMIRDSQLGCQMYAGVPKPVLYSKKAETKGAWSLAGTVILNTPQRTGFAGLVCNYQNPEQQYVFRFNGEGTVQFLSTNSRNTILNRPNAFVHRPGTPYQLMITSVVPGQFDLLIRNLETGESMFSQTVKDPKQLYTGGFGGFYNSTGSARFADFSFSEKE